MTDPIAVAARPGFPSVVKNGQRFVWKKDALLRLKNNFPLCTRTAKTVLAQRVLSDGLSAQADANKKSQGGSLAGKIRVCRSSPGGTAAAGAGRAAKLRGGAGGEG